VEIRHLTEDDAAAYQDIRLRALREDPEGFSDTYEEAVKRPLSFTVERIRAHNPADGTFTLGAFDGVSGAGALVGTVTLIRGQRVKLRHRADIVAMYVAPEARRAGVGRALLAEVRARAERIVGLEQLHLFVITSNEAACRLYRATGFVTYGIEPHAVKLGDRYWDEELMVLQLRQP
jgi:ribosomal protein S18 acetylase RimI-like enzyme